MADDSSEIVKEQSESVAATNLKTLGDGPAFFQNANYAESLANTQAMNQLRMTLLGKVSESIISVSPAEGGSDVAALGQLMKGLYNTPPTGMSGSGGGEVSGIRVNVVRNYYPFYSTDIGFIRNVEEPVLWKISLGKSY